ncbi:HEAT repeat domain-containing protein [Anaeromyxobacter oryzisoli]|uniref:HEAT repeat domain-containing protein n=1 Tax=Anaeromyxobacter oryzisoli TaxID=2925408 RepID=UPI001F5700A9|nr:HEAT repeat domain-containing protein [Anaeromyxobacter sp. SG63]
MRALRHAILCLAGALSVAGAGCQRGPRIDVGAVRVAQGALAEPLREAGLDEAALERAARDALVAEGFRKGADVRAAHTARVDVLAVRLSAPSGDRPAVEVSVEIQLVPPEGAAGLDARETGTGSAPLAGSTPAEAWSRALAGAARGAAAGLALARKEAAKPTGEVIADLSSQDARVRGHAVRALAERRDATALPALVARLEDPDPEIVMRAVGALAQLRDRRAVGPLIDLSRKGDPALTARLARVIGDIGGPEARGYLLTVEAGHLDPRVQRSAREALEEMDARQRQEAAGRVAAGR